MNHAQTYAQVHYRLQLLGEQQPQPAIQRNPPSAYEGGRADESVEAQKWVPNLNDRMRGLQNPMPNGSPFELVGGSDES